MSSGFFCITVSLFIRRMIYNDHRRFFRESYSIYLSYFRNAFVFVFLTSLALTICNMKYIALLAPNPIVEIFTYRQNRLQILKKRKAKVILK